MQKSDDDDEDSTDTPEYKPSRTTLAHARARALQAVKGKQLWDVVDEFTLQALIDLEMARQFGDEKLKFQAARELIQTWTRMPHRPTAPPAKGMTPEEYRAALDAAEQDPAVREYLAKKGWTAPKQAKEQN